MLIEALDFPPVVGNLFCSTFGLNSPVPILNSILAASLRVCFHAQIHGYVDPGRGPHSGPASGEYPGSKYGTTPVGPDGQPVSHFSHCKNILIDWNPQWDLKDNISVS